MYTKLYNKCKQEPTIAPDLPAEKKLGKYQSMLGKLSSRDLIAEGDRG